MIIEHINAEKLRQRIVTSWAGGPSFVLDEGNGWRAMLTRFSNVSQGGMIDFSRFPDRRRLFVPLLGHVGLFVGEDRKGELIEKGRVHSFDGAEKTRCQVIESPVEVFNLIYQDDRFPFPQFQWPRSGDNTFDPIRQRRNRIVALAYEGDFSLVCPEKISVKKGEGLVIQPEESDSLDSSVRFIGVPPPYFRIPFAAS